MSTSNFRINHIESTPDLITGRAGLAPFCKYLESTGILNRLESEFSSIKGSSKGIQVKDFFKQMMAWIMDGTSRHINYFDELKKDEGYAATLETDINNLASSHAIDRMCEKFTKLHEPILRNILLDYCMERMKLEKPNILEISVDSMVMDNNEAKKRHGVNCTYKKCMGFHPMQIVWNGMIIDGIFRSGEKPTNEITKTLSMLKRLIKRIKKDMDDTVTLVVRLDSGYYDQRIMNYLDGENIAFIVSGKMYEFVKDATQSVDEDSWEEYQNGKSIWMFSEYGLRSKSWENFYRAIFTQDVTNSKGEIYLDFARPSNVILTNIGVNDKVLLFLSKKDKKHWLKAKTVIESHHGRGADELPHRSLKELGFEALPFQKFSENMLVYQCMVLSLALFEGFKRDVLIDVVSPKSYANTVRRKFIDIAGKFTKSGGAITLKLRTAVLERLNFVEIWCRATSPPFKI